MSTELSTYANHYTAKKAMFSFLGSTFRLYGDDGSLQFFVKQKAFKLKEELVVFKDEAQSIKRLTINANKRSDFGATYAVTDVASGEAVGALRREGLKSIFRDEWTVLDTAGNPVGKVQETGGFLSVMRRLVDALKFIPQTYEVTIGGEKEGVIKQRFNPFQLGYDVDFSPGTGKLDPRLGVGITVLLLAIEGRRD